MFVVGLAEGERARQAVARRLVLGLACARVETSTSWPWLCSEVWSGSGARVAWPKVLPCSQPGGRRRVVGLRRCVGLLQKNGTGGPMADFYRGVIGGDVAHAGSKDKEGMAERECLLDG